MALPTLSSGRLVLRPLVATDAAAIVSGLSDWQVTQWLTVVPYPYGIEDAQAFLASVAERPEAPFWAIDAGKGLIGAVSVAPDLGYWLASPQHGHGYMTEAAAAVVDWFFAQSSGPLESGYHLGNARSARVLDKLGFRPGEVVVKEQRSTGQPVQVQTMSLSQADWLARK